jgi:hypothetical protein
LSAPRWLCSAEAEVPKVAGTIRNMGLAPRSGEAGLELI